MNDHYETYQSRMWSSDFGKSYTVRNQWTSEQINQIFKDRFGVTRLEMNAQLLCGLDRGIRILEVGCNIGLQLEDLRTLGFHNLYGIDLQQGALDIARQRLGDIQLLQGSGFDIPFKDDWFDLVFTSTVLVHIAPQDIDRMLGEIHRVSRGHIWGYEFYHAPGYASAPYRGEEGLLWKTDFCGRYLELFPNLEVVDRRRYRYIGQDLEDENFLLCKKGGKGPGGAA